MSLKKVRGGVTGFGDTLVSKTCHFFCRVSRKGERGGGGRFIWYSTVYKLCGKIIEHIVTNSFYSIWDSFRENCPTVKML